VSVPTDRLAEIHQRLVMAFEGGVGVLYRQVVDRISPRPEGAPPRDWVALEQDPARVCAALQAAADLVYHDARCELWVRGAQGDKVVLDMDGVLYVYPDDPLFTDVLDACGVSEGLESTILDQDYAKHWYHASCDALEREFIDSLRLAEVAPQRR
jgi:hypothetical protein